MRLTIGEFGRESGLSAKALRLYDESGLLAPAEIDASSGYRYYDPEQLVRARRISLLRQLGIGLAEVKVILSLVDSGPGAVQRIDAWWTEQERQHAERRGLRQYLVADLTDGTAGLPDDQQFQVGSREVPDRLIASITQAVHQPELLGTMKHLLAAIHDHLRRTGADHGDEHWVIYHGPVSPDNDGPIEVCVPYAGTTTPTTQIGLRIESAHRLAYTPISRRQFDYPDILHAYDAVNAWITRWGSPAGSSREIYDKPWSETDPVADIARPYLPR